MIGQFLSRETLVVVVIPLIANRATHIGNERRLDGASLLHSKKVRFKKKGCLSMGEGRNLGGQARAA
jgi:hypothetical protein